MIDNFQDSQLSRDFLVNSEQQKNQIFAENAIPYWAIGRPKSQPHELVYHTNQSDRTQNVLGFLDRQGSAFQEAARVFPWGA